VSRKCKTSQAPASHRSALRNVVSTPAGGFRLNISFSAEDWEEEDKSPPSPGYWSLRESVVTELVEDFGRVAVRVDSPNVGAQAAVFAVNFAGVQGVG